MLEKFFLGDLLKKIPAVFSHVYVVLVILISFVLFSANGISGAIADIGGMFGAGGISFWSQKTGYYLSSYAFVLLFALVGSTPVVKNTVLKIKEKKVGKIIIDILEPIFVLGMLFIVTAYFVDGSFSPFLYFRF
jgi:alginate O-acetyltransferase complex protein AlgI